MDRSRFRFQVAWMMQVRRFRRKVLFPSYIRDKARSMCDTEKRQAGSELGMLEASMEKVLRDAISEAKPDDLAYLEGQVSRLARQLARLAQERLQSGS